MSIAQLRASDFVILKGVSAKNGKAYEFAKIDSRCSLMNNPVFLKSLKEEGAREFVIGATNQQ